MTPHLPSHKQVSTCLHTASSRAENHDTEGIGMNDHRHDNRLSLGMRARGLGARGVFVAAIAAAGVFAGCEPAAETSAELPENEPELASIELRLSTLEAKEEIRTILLAVATVVDSADPARLDELVPHLTEDFVLDAVDFDGVVHHFEGVDGVTTGFGPIMKEADANLMPSAIDVELDGNTAYASFKFANSVKPPPQLNLPVDVKVLLFAANSAVLRKENGAWKLASFELLHSLAYPGSLPPP
ncbi:nuclear transport factor 2 family protein [Sorangium sp. So ce281]|uniref:nuclear transport factor 2 family protein n=1 Tax=unclassified Sorangium TaxID=2621164 RepID=UPI003F5EABCE